MVRTHQARSPADGPPDDPGGGESAVKPFESSDRLESAVFQEGTAP